MSRYTDQDLFSILEYSAKSLGFSEKEIFEFTRCVRPNGSVYGSRGRCKKGTEQAKEEEVGYKPKKTVGGGAVNINPDQIEYSAFDVKSAREDYDATKKSVAGKLKKLDSDESLSQGEKDKRRERLKNSLAVAKTTLRQAENNRKFLSDLEKKVPQGVELRVTGLSGIVLLAKTKGGNAVTVTYSPNDGFNFMVNGKYSAGVVTDRREQVETSLIVKKCWDSVVQTLPEGTIVKTAAWDGDGKGASREKAYMRVGFSKGDETDGYMYSQKTNGKMRPTTDKEAYEAQDEDPNAIYFSEEAAATEEVKIWLQILTGEDFL